MLQQWAAAAAATNERTIIFICIGNAQQINNGILYGWTWIARYLGRAFYQTCVYTAKKGKNAIKVYADANLKKMNQ